MNHFKINGCFRTYQIILALFLLSYTEIDAQPGITELHSFQSSILKQKENYTVILPENYYKTTERYPVIYLLHGIGGDEESWIRRCNFNTLVDSLKNLNLITDFIYVMPDARNSYYIDNYNKSYCYESFFINELIPVIDSVYRTIPSPTERTIMGLSMGGFGAVILGIKHPEKFGSVISMSGALRDSLAMIKLPQDKYNRLFSGVFGPDLTAQYRVTKHWKNNSPYYLIDSAYANTLMPVNWYIDCASGDSLYPVNDEFHKLLMDYNIPHEFHSRPGQHNWAYWYTASAKALMYNSYLIHKKMSSKLP
jgi:enterochelin esterase-like enzyme